MDSLLVLTALILGQVDLPAGSSGPPAPVALAGPGSPQQPFTSSSLGELCCPCLPAPAANEGVRDLFQAHRCSLQVMAGTYWATSLGPQGPPLNYAPVAVRLGYQLNDPNPDHLLTCGTWEVLVEGLVAPTLTNFGSRITGPSLLLRNNLA